MTIPDWVQVYSFMLTEVILLTALSVRFADCKVNYGKALILSILFTPLLYFFRSYFIFGFHMIFCLLVYPLLLSLVMQIAYRKIIRSYVYSFSILIAAEIGTEFILTHTLQILTGRSFYHFLLTAIPQITLFSLLLILRRCAGNVKVHLTE